MYSGTTLRTKSGRVIGAHQRIDRIAKRRLRQLVGPSLKFPTIKDILYFEGKNGPDGIKSKSPGKDEPWHFIDPYHEGDHSFFDTINDHIANLGAALRSDNMERAAFEAGWLAHAITDGLTPAHHYPFEEHLEQIRGEGLHTRSSKKGKVIMPGKTKSQQLKNNWDFWGSKGVMSTHLGFELGVATAIPAGKFGDIDISDEMIRQVEAGDYEAVFRQLLKDVANLHMYEAYMARGWSSRLARQTTTVLIPHIVQAVTLGWYAGICEAKR